MFNEYLRGTMQVIMTRFRTHQLTDSSRLKFDHEINNFAQIWKAPV